MSPCCLARQDFFRHPRKRPLHSHGIERFWPARRWQGLGQRSNNCSLLGTPRALCDHPGKGIYRKLEGYSTPFTELMYGVIPRAVLPYVPEPGTLLPLPPAAPSPLASCAEPRPCAGVGRQQTHGSSSAAPAETMGGCEMGHQRESSHHGFVIDRGPSISSAVPCHTPLPHPPLCPALCSRPFAI